MPEIDQIRQIIPDYPWRWVGSLNSVRFLIFSNAYHMLIRFQARTQGVFLALVTLPRATA